MFDSPIDNITYLTSLLQQAETLYRNELWYAESNTSTIQNSFLGQMGDKNKLPSDKIRDLFSEQFKQLDAMVESDEEKIRLYKAGLLRGFNPTIDEDGDGKVDWYLHRDGQLYRVRQAGSDAADTKAVSYYNEDGTLDRIEIDGMFGVYADQFVQGFGGAIAGIADLFIYGTVGIADTIENIFTGNWEYDKLADVYKEVEGFKGGTYLLGNNVYSTSSGWTNSDGTIDGDGIARGVARGVGILAGMLTLSAVGGGLSNFGTAVVKLPGAAGKQVITRTIVKNGILDSGIRSLGNAINGVVGLSQGVYRAGAGNAVLTATQATVRGLGYLAVKDFTTTVGSLTASKDLLGMTDQEIIGKSLTMTGLNFGLSFLLRSVGDTPATTRLANFWKAKFQKTAEIKAAGALDDTFADALLRWAGDASKRKSFVFVNSAMDVAENMLTMGTQTSLATTGKLFDKDAWSGLLDPQNVALQGWLFRNNLVGGLRGNDMQMGAAGVAAQLDNLNRVYNNDILGKMLLIASEKSASKADADVKVADTINMAVRRATEIKNSEKNPALGIQKAIMYLHDTFKDEGDLSFVRDAIVSTYNKARTDEIVLGTKAAIETYTNVASAKTNIQKDALLKGDIFAPGSFISSKLTGKKLQDIQRIAQQFEGALANMARYDLVNKLSSFEVLKQTNMKALYSNKKEFETVATLAGTTIETIGELKFVPKEIKNADGTTKTVYEISTPEGKLVEKDQANILNDFIQLVGKGNPNSIKGYAMLSLPTTGDAAGQSARLKVAQLLDTFVEIARADASNDVISPIYKLADGMYVIPSFNDGVTIKTMTEMHTALANLYGVKYNLSFNDKAKSFQNLFEVMEGKAYSKDSNVIAVSLINKLLEKGFITLDEAAGLLNSETFANIKTDASVDLKNFANVNKALLYAKGVKLLEAFREAKSNQTPTRDQGVVEKTQKEFMDYYTNELQSEPELQQLLAKRNGFSRNDLLNFIKENPLKDKDRLLSLFKTLSTGLGIKDDGGADDRFRNEIVKQLIDLTGIKEIVSDSYPDAVLEGLRKVGADQTTNVGKVILSLIGGVKSTQDLRPKILDIKVEDIKKAIEESKARLVKEDGSAWNDDDTNLLLTDIKKSYFNLKAETIKDLIFNGSDRLLLQNLISFYDKVNVGDNKLAFSTTIDRLTTNEEGERDFIYERLLSDKQFVDDIFSKASEPIHLEKALQLFQETFIKDTIARSTSGKLLLNVNELLGYYQTRFIDGLKNVYKTEKITSASTVEDKLRQVFGEKYVDFVKGKLSIETFVQENIYHMYKDRVVAGNLEFSFSIVDGKLRMSNPSELSVLNKILKDLGYEFFDLQEGLDNIPGIYFKVQSSDAAIDLEFEKAKEGSISPKSLFLDGLRKDGGLKWDEIKADVYIANVDFYEAIVNRTGNLNFINDDTTFEFNGDVVPRFYGSTNFAISEKVKSIIDASPDINIKQGRNGGALFKAYFIARALPGMLSDVDMPLKKNVFILDTIDVINDFINKEGLEGKTIILSEMALTKEQIDAFKNNGDLYDFEFVKDYDDKTNRGYGIYLVKPKKDFKQRAFDYINKNGKINLNYVLPEGIVGTRTALENSIVENKTTQDVSNVALANTSRLLTINTTGYDLVTYINANIRYPYSEEFIIQSYLSDIIFNKKGLDLEETIAKQLRNKSYKEIIALGNTAVQGTDILLKDTLYFEMLSRFLVGSRQLSEQMMASFGMDKNNQDLNIILSNEEVRKAIGRRMQVILKESKTKPILDANDSRLVDLRNEVNKILDKNDTVLNYTGDRGFQTLMHGTEPNDKTSIESYSIAALGLKNKTTAIINTDDLLSLYKSVTEDGEFRALSSISKEAVVDKVASKLYAITNTSDSKDQNRVSIFVDDIYRLSSDEFSKIYSYLKASGVKQSSLDVLESKYKFINQNSSFYQAIFNNKLDGDYVIQERLAAIAGLPSAVRDNTIAFSLKNGEYAKELLKAFYANAEKQPFVSSNIASKSVKASAVDLDKRNPFLNLMANLKNRIEQDAETPMTGSRLVQNLQHYEFLGKLMYNVSAFGKNIQAVLEGRGIKIGVADATKIAFTIFNQSTGVTYDKFYSDVFFFDTKDNTIKAVTGSGNTAKGFGYVASRYLLDYANKEPNSVIAFQVDKDALLSSTVKSSGAVKYMVLDNEKSRILQELVNNFVYRDLLRSPSKELPANASVQDTFAYVLGRYTNQSDRLDHITATLTKLKIPHQYARTLAKTLFFNGQNVLVGSNKDSLAATKTMNTLKLGDSNYRTSNAKENNVQKSLNDALYFINVNDLPSDYTRELRVMASEYELSLSKDNNYRNDVIETVRLILSKGTKDQDVLNKMEAFANKQISLEQKKNFLQDVTALYILRKNDGATHNFMLLDNNVNDLMIKATNGSKLDFLTQDGSKIDASRLLAQDFYVGDIENAWYIDSKGNQVPLVLELTLNNFRGISNVEKFFDDKASLELIRKETIVIPAFYNKQILTEELLNLETKDMDPNSTREQRLARLLPDYYQSFFIKFGESSRAVWDNYFRNIEGVIKKNNIKTIADAGEYILNKARALGYDGNKFLLSFNGKSHDFGSSTKESVLTKAGYLKKDNSFFQNKHVDIFSDLYTSNRFEVDSYQDQQGMALVDIAAKLGIAYDKAHTSDADVKATADIAIKLLATVSNSNRFTSNILNVFEDLRTNLGLSDTDIKPQEQTAKLKKLSMDWFNEDTKEFIENYRYAFDQKNLAQFNKAFNTIVNSLKDYLDTVEKEVKRKQVRELVKDELGRRFDFFEKVQKNSKELASIIEYFVYKQEKFTRNVNEQFNRSTLLGKAADQTGQSYALKSGFLKLYDIFREAFGDIYQDEKDLEVDKVTGEVKTYKALSALGLEKLFSLDPKELFETLAGKKMMVPGYQLSEVEISYQDYLRNKENFNGSRVRTIVEELKQDGTLAKINDEEQSYRLLNKFASNNESIFGSIIEGLDKNIQDIILNEAATPYLKNLGLSDKQYADRIRNRGLKLDDSKFLASLKKLVADSSFGTTFHYNAFFEQANQADYLRKYEMENGASENIGFNEIGLTAKKYEELTGLSYEDAKALFKVNEGGSIYLNVMRHPVDKIGSIASLKVRILADTPENNRYTTLVNIDMLYSILAGDVDGDYITIVTPTKGMVEFNRTMAKFVRKGNDLVGQAIRGLTDAKRVDESLELKLAFDFDRPFSEMAFKDRKDLLSGKVSFEAKKEQRLRKLKNLLADRKIELSDKKVEKLLSKIWLQEYDLSVFISDVSRKVYYSANRFLNDDLNSKAFKELSFAKTRNFGAQAISDTAPGFYANLSNRVGENIKAKDAKFILNYSAFGLTDSTQDFITENLPQFKSVLLQKVQTAYENKELFIDENDYKALVNLIQNSQDGLDITSAMNKLDAVIFESKDFGKAYLDSYNKFKELDKDRLSSNESYNINLLSEFAKGLGITIGDAFDLAAIQESLYEKLADYSAGNFWASSGSSSSRKGDLLRKLTALENEIVDPEGKTKPSIIYHEEVAGMRDKDGFRADLHSNVVIVFDNNKFKDSMPLNDADNYMYVKGSVEQIRMAKAYLYSLNSLDTTLANKLLTLRDGNQDVKEDILLSNGNVIPKGFKIINVIELNDGSFKVLTSYETGFQEGTKVVVPGSKIAKATNGGELKGSLAQAIKKNKLNVDFVYGSSSFDYKNMTPLIGKFFNESQIKYYKLNESTGETVQVNKATDADFAILEELPMKLTQTFFEGKVKTTDVDDITLSTSKRNIFGNILFGDTFINVDKNDPTKLTFNSEKVAQGAKALDVLNQPTLIGNNAAYLHGTLINLIALKYSDLTKDQQSERMNEMTTNYDMGSDAAINNFWYIIQEKYDNKIENLIKKASPVEQVILSSNLYNNFFNLSNGKILESADDLIQKSKNSGFERQLSPSSSTLRGFKPEGEMGRQLARKLSNSIFNNKYNGSLVFDNTFGYMSTLEYLKFIINSMNTINKGVPGYKPLAFITAKDATDASLLNILNIGKGVGGSLYEGFKSINLRDSLIETNPENYGLSFSDQKTGFLMKGTPYEIFTKKFKPSPFSEVRKSNDFQQTERNYTDRISSTNRPFDTVQNKYVFDSTNLRSNINTNVGDSTLDTNLRHGEVRFLKYLLGSIGNAKDIYERVGLFGYNDRVYAPLSVTGIAINSNDNRMSFGYDNEFISTNIQDLEKTIQEKINSRRFLDLFDFKSNKLKESIEGVVKKDLNNIALTTKIPERKFDKAKDIENILTEKPGTERYSAGQNIWNGLFKEETPLDNDDIKFRQRVFFEANKEKLTTVFSEDLLRSGLFKIVNGDFGLSIEVERAVRDYLIEPKILEKQFTQPLKNLFEFASSLGISDKLNHYAAAKYYVYAIQKIENTLGQTDIKESDRSSLTILLETYKQDFNELKTGFNTPQEFMASFEKLYGTVVKEFNDVNSYLGLQFKQYSVMTDEASDSLFYLLKPNVRKGLEKEEKTFMRLSMFTFNDEREYESVDLASYNYFDDLHTKLIMLSKQAATVKLSNKLKSLGLLANLPVKDLLMKNIREQLQSAADKFNVFGVKGEELVADVNDFVKDIDATLIKYFGLPKVGNVVYSALSNGNIGRALYITYEILEKELANVSKGMSREQAMIQMRLAKVDSPEHKEAIGIMNLYELQNQALIMLTNRIDKDVLGSIYTSLKAEANRNGTVLTDRFGRILHEDPRDYKMLFAGSTEAVKHLVKFSSYGGGYEKNIILDALNGDVFFGNKSLVEALDKNFFTTKMPNKILQSIAKLNGLVSKLIMSNPFRYLDRLLGFTLYDVATLGSFEPKTFTKVSVAINQVSAFLQSKFSVVSPELKEFFNESGIDIKTANLSELFSGFDQKGLLDKLIDPIAEPLGKGFNIQNIVGRFSYWLAVKENLDNNKQINYGPSLKIKNAVDSLTAKYETDPVTGEIKYNALGEPIESVSTNGRKAYFLMSEILGAPGDFPILARKLKGLAMFTTFPLAAARFTRGLLGSASTSLKELLIGDNKQVALRWLTSTGLGMAGLFAVPWLIFELWGNVMGLSEEEKEEWKEQGDGMPEFVRSVFTGSPVINKFNTFNQYALLDSMTFKPFREAMDEGGTIVDGAGRWILDNVASRGPAPLKLTAEVLGGFDSFGGTIQDTSDQWSMWENFQRKVAAYVIGGSGANALTNYLNKDLKYSNDSFVDMFVNGFRVVIEAEMGNTSAFKTDIKNYYRANNIIQTARFANENDTYYTSSNFDTENYNDVKSEISRALRRKAKPSVIYGIIMDSMKKGVGLPEIRSALRNNSLEYKLSQVPNLGEFYSNLNESEYKTINDAIAYERQTYPFLNQTIEEVNNLYSQNTRTSRYSPRVYIPRVYNNNNYKTNYSYNYENFVRNSRYNNLFKIYDPYKSFRASWFKLNNLDRPREE